MKRSLLPRWLRKTAPITRLSVIQLEDRLTPAVTAAFDGATHTLTVTLDAASDAATLSVVSGKIDLAGTSFVETQYANVQSISVVDAGSNDGQMVTFNGANSFALIGTLSVTGIETVTFSTDLAADDGLTITGATTTTVSSKISSSNDIGFTSSAISLIGGTIASTGTVSLTANSIGIDAASSVQGAVGITLITTDLATAGQDITISGSVQSANGIVDLEAGDNLSLTGTGSVTAGDKITMTIDANSADLVGGIATIDGTLSASNGATLDGNSNADTFNVFAQAKAAIAINGGDPSTTPGDTLNFDAQNKALAQTATSLQVLGALPVTFTNIETVATANVGGTLVLGTAGNDSVIVSDSGAGPSYTLNGGTSTPIVGKSLVFAGGKGTDTLTVDNTATPLVLANGISFDGSGGSNDLLRILGSNTSAINYAPDAATSGNGVVTIDGLAVTFTNLQPLDVIGGASFGVTLPGAADILAVDEGTLFSDATKAAIVISGTSGGVPIESVAVRGVTTMTIDTTSNEITADPDAITVSSLDANPGVTNLTIITAPAVGTGTDTVTFTGSPDLPGDLNVTTNTVQIKSVAITTGGSQTYNAANVRLFTDAAFTSSTNAALTLNAALGGAFSAAFDTAGVTTFNGNVNVAALSTDALGSTTISGSGAPTTITASTSLEFADAVTLSQDATFAAPTVTFDSTLDGSHNAIVNATTTTFSGAIGSGTALASMTTDAAGTTIFAKNVTATTLIDILDSALVSGDLIFAAATVKFEGTLDDSVAGADAVSVNATNTSFTKTVGTTALKSLTTDSTGTTTITASVTATDLLLFNDTVIIGGNVTLSAATVTFKGTLNDAAADTHTVTVNATATTFVNVVGTTPLAALTTDAAGTTTVDAGITAGKLIQFNDNVIIGGNATLSAATVTFAGTLDDSTAGAHTVAVNATTTMFEKDVGSTAPLASLKTDAPGTTSLGGNVTATNLIEFDDSVTITSAAANPAITASTVTFKGTLDDSTPGTHNLTINATNTTFATTVGTIALASLTTDAAGTTTVDAGITAGTFLQFNDNVRIGGDATFNSPTVAFNGTVDDTTSGQHNVVVNAMTTSFEKNVGSTLPLGSLKTDAPGTTSLGGNVTAANFIEFDDSVIITSAAANVSISTATVTFDGTLDDSAAGLHNLAVDATTTSFAKTVGTTPFNSLTTDLPGITTVGASITAENQILFNDNVIVSGNDTFTASTVTFKGTLDDISAGTHAVIVDATATTFAQAVGTKALASLKTDLPGNTTVGASVTATNFIEFDDNVVISGNATFTAATVTFDGTLDDQAAGTHAVIVNATLSTFAKDVGGLAALGSLKADAPGTTNIDGNITATIFIEFDDSAIAGSNAFFTASTITFNGTFNDNAAGTHTVNINAATTTFANTVGTTPFARLTTDMPGTTFVGANITATDFILFLDNVVVRSDVTLTASSVTFGGTLNDVTSGAHNVIIAAAAPTFSQAVGTTPLASLKISLPGTAIVAASMTATNFIEFDDNVIISGNDTFTAGKVSFNGTLDDATGTHNLVVDAGTTLFAKDVGATTPLLTLTTDASGTTTLGGNVTATNLIQFGDSVTIASAAANAAISAATVTFKGTLDDSAAGTHNLAVNATNTTFLQAIGSVQPLLSLTTDAAGSTDINGGRITTTADQVYKDDVILSANTVLTSTGGNITFDKTVNPSTAGLTLGLSAGLDILFAGTAGNNAVLGQVTAATARNVTLDSAFKASGFTQTAGSGTTEFDGPLTATTAAGINLTTQFIVANSAVTSAGNFTVGDAVNVMVTASGSVTGSGIVQASGSGTTQVSGPVKATTATGINLTTAAIVLAANANSVGAILLDATTGGVNQTAGAITATGLILAGNGTFSLNQSGNAFSTLAVNTGSGAVTVQDQSVLAISDTSRIVTANGNVTLNLGTNFSAKDATGHYTTPVVDLGTGAFTVVPGLNGDSRTTFDAEIQAASATFGSTAGLNSHSDEFDVRPSAFTAFTVLGNAPVPPLAAGQTGDQLLPLFEGATVTGFAYDGQNGFFQFSNRKEIDFKGIESLKELSYSAVAVLTNEPGDANSNPKNPTTQPQYAIRVAVSEATAPLPTSLNGSGVAQNPFVVSPARVDPNGSFLAPQMAFAQLNSDGEPDLVIGNGPGTGAVVSVVDGQNIISKTANKTNNLSALTLDPGGGLLAQFYPYDASFTGGVNVAAATLSNTQAVVITAPDIGGGPEVRVFSVDRSTGKLNTNAFSFFAFESSFRGGVRLATGDVNGDGVPDLIVAAGPGGGPRVRVFDGNALFNHDQVVPIEDFFAYDSSFRGGVYIDAGDFNGDGKADLLTAPGTGGSDHIQVYNFATHSDLVQFFANLSPATSDPLFSSGAYRLGVGGVAFGTSAIPGKLAILVSSPYGIKTTVDQFDWTSPTAFSTTATNIVTTAKIEPIAPDPSTLSYGATVEGFEGS